MVASSLRLDLKPGLFVTTSTSRAGREAGCGGHHSAVDTLV